MSVIVFDTECTGRSEDREVIEAAWICFAGVLDLAGPSEGIPQPLIDHLEDAFCERYCPSKPMEFGAIAVHNILPHELEGLPPPSEFKLPEGTEYLVGHSIDFDHEAIGSPDVKRICTHAMAQHVWPDADSYSQSALLYMVLGTTDETRARLKNAHSALTDVENNILLLQAILDEKPEIETWSQLWEFSEQSRIPLRMPITKARGGFLTDIDDGLLQWCLSQHWLPGEHPYLHEGLLQEHRRRNEEWRDNQYPESEPDHIDADLDDLPF